MLASGLASTTVTAPDFWPLEEELGSQGLGSGSLGFEPGSITPPDPVAC